jgi:hypothetical protein
MGPQGDRTKHKLGVLMLQSVLQLTGLCLERYTEGTLSQTVTPSVPEGPQCTGVYQCEGYLCKLYVQRRKL